MAFEKRLASLFALDEEGWARHANPWSGYSRMVTGLPLLAFAVWSRVWIGWWSLMALVAALAWLWLNPRLFAPPGDDSDWMTRGVLGERFWVERNNGVEFQGKGRVTTLYLITGLGAFAMVYGLVMLDFIWTLVGGAVAWIAKTWFIHIMSRHYDRVVKQRPELRYRGSN